MYCVLIPQDNLYYMYVLKATNIILLSDAANPLGTAVCTNDQWNSCFEQLFITNEYSLSDAITSQMFAVKLRTKTTDVYKLIDIWVIGCNATPKIVFINSINSNLN